MLKIPHRLWWQALILTVLSAGSVLLGVMLDKKVKSFLPESNSFPSSFNSAASGYSALKEVLAASGMPVYAWQNPYRLLPQAHGTLIMIRPDHTPEAYEIKQILAWVESGNNLIYLDDLQRVVQPVLLKNLGLQRVAEDPVSSSEQFLRFNPGNPVFCHVRQITTGVAGHLQGGNTLLSDSTSAVALEVDYGQGRVLVGAIPDVCANHRISKPPQPGNFQFFCNWLNLHGHKVYFDEYAHGFQQGNSFISYVAKSWAGLLFAQLLLIFVIYLLSSWQRFGQALPIKNARRPCNHEYILALANTYKRAYAANLAWSILDRNFTFKLSRALSLSSHDHQERLCQSWSQATGCQPEILSAYLEQSRIACSNPNLSEQELFRLSKLCAKISELSTTLFANSRSA